MVYPSFILSTNQFLFLFYNRFQDSINFKPTFNYLSKIQKNNDNSINEINKCLNYILYQEYNCKKKFQRFILGKSYICNINHKIDLEDLKNTCESKELQIILLILFIYYFSI